MCEKGNTYLLLGYVKICADTMEVSVAVPQGRESIYLKSSSTPLGHLSKDSAPYDRDPCSSVFTAALFASATNENSLVVSQWTNG